MVKRLIAVVLVVCMAITIGPAFAFSGTTQASSGKIASATTYTDVSPNHWALKIIQTLSNEGVINGYADGTFKPDNKVSRAEFTKMLMVYMNISADNTPTGSFTDVLEGYWAHDFIEGAKATDLVDGYADKMFKPNNNITRAEIAQIMTAAQAKVQKLAQFKASSVDYPFPDISSSWARESIVTMHGLHIIDGYPDGQFKPDRTATRTEAAKMLYLLVSAVLGKKITPPSSGSSGGGNPEPTPQPECPSIERPNADEKPFTNRNGQDNRLEILDRYEHLRALVFVPDGAVGPESTITVAVNFGDTLPQAVEDAQQASEVISVSKDKCCNFKIPIEVTIPWQIRGDMGEGDVPSVFYWDESSKKYIAVDITGFDRPYMTGGNGEITFRTVHAGKYVALAVPGLSQAIAGESLTTVTDTMFRPAAGSFPIENYGDFSVPGDRSIGMVNYAGWYYLAKGIGLTDQSGIKDDESAAKELATRAYLASSNVWNYLIQGELRLRESWNLDDDEIAYQLIQTMKITHAPQVMIMTHGSDAGTPLLDARAVLVYRYDVSEGYGRFYFYDPNYKLVEKSVSWSRGGGFGSYTPDEGVSFYGFKFDGISTFLQPSHFERLYTGSFDKFPAASFGTISIEGDIVDDVMSVGSSVTITGTVTPGAYVPEHITYNFDGVTHETTLEVNNGVFSFTVDCPDGDTSLIMYSTENECATDRRCAKPFSAVKEIILSRPID